MCKIILILDKFFLKYEGVCVCLGGVRLNWPIPQKNHPQKARLIRVEKKKKNHDKIVFVAKSKLYSIEVIISKALIDSVITHEQFLLINNVLKEYNELKEGIKNLKIQSSFYYL